MNISRLQNILSTLAFLWLGVVLLLVGTLVFLLPHARINSSILDLLPPTQQKRVDPELMKGFTKRLDEQLIWLVKSTDGGDKAAEAWVSALQNIPGLKKVYGRMTDADFMAWGKSLNEFKYALLDQDTREKLISDPQSYQEWVIAQVYSPFSGVTMAELAHDPLLLARAQLFSQQKNAGQLHMASGWLISKVAENEQWYFIRAELADSSYDVTNVSRLMKAFDVAIRSVKNEYPDFEVIRRGALYYSDYASTQAMKDISTIGVLSTLGIVLLIMGLFRSVLPLGLTLLSLFVGIMSGVTMVLLIFGEIHLVTLVMSSSIIGVAIDYALLFLTERMVHGKVESPLESMKKILLPLLGAVISTAVAYLMLVFAPFIGMRQLAVFAVTGLIAVFLTVVLWFPFCSRNLPQRVPQKLFNGVSYWVALWDSSCILRIGLPIVFLVFAVVGVSALSIDDDISQLQALPQDIYQEELRVATITGQTSEQRMALVVGRDQDEAVRALEKVLPVLAQAQTDGLISGYKALPFVSMVTQQNNIALIKKRYPEMLQALSSMEIETAFTLPAMSTVSPAQWLESPLSEGWRLSWLTLPDGMSAIAIPLAGIVQPDALKARLDATESAFWVDRKTEISTLFAHYRVSMSMLFGGAFLCVSLLFVSRFGLKQGTYCMLPVAFALVTALAALGWLGISVNLFSILALILVVGISIDYTLFFNNHHGQANVAMLTIFSAALISELTFGLLAFSHTDAIAGFGVVLAVGIFTALLMSPLARPRSTHNGVQ